MNPDLNPATPNLPPGFTSFAGPTPIEDSTTDVPLPLKAKLRFDWRHCARRLLVCNPFFLCSAALLLFAINRLSVDPTFLPIESQNLLFNFFALQGYEWLVIVTALILVYRKVWYDSALLVVLENGLILVPFMLLSQATLLGPQLAWLLTLSGGFLAIGRVIGLRKFYPQFNLPGRTLLLGAIILAANVALPRVFRPWIEKDVEDWLVPNLVAWWAVLPLIAAGANLLPRPWRYGGSNPERHWLPLFIYGLWIGGSAVHCWCLAHICGLPFARAWLGPLGLVCAWTAWNRLTDFVPNPARWLKNAILLLTFLAPLCAFPEHHLFILLCAVNFIAYIVLALFRTDIRRTARELAFANLPLLLAGLPLEWRRLVLPEDDQTWWIFLAFFLYLAAMAFRIRWISMALIGGVAFGTATFWLLWALVAACRPPGRPCLCLRP